MADSHLKELGRAKNDNGDDRKSSDRELDSHTRHLHPSHIPLQPLQQIRNRLEPWCAAPRICSYGHAQNRVIVELDIKDFSLRSKA
jgi:hypothetical protein